MLFSKAPLATLRCALAWPGLIEIGTCTVVIGFYVYWLPEYWIRALNYKAVLMPLPVAVAFWVAAVRHWLDPVFSRVYRTVATFWTLLLIPNVFVFDWKSQIGEYFSSLLFAGFMAFVALSLWAGIRNRHLAIPPLLIALKANHKRVRRMAAATLVRIAAYDRAAGHDDCVVWLRQWAFSGHTHPVATDAVPALQDALRDGDEIVRYEAAKALKQIGKGNGDATNTVRYSGC